jgi:hypothetical protein
MDLYQPDNIELDDIDEEEFDSEEGLKANKIFRFKKGVDLCDDQEKIVTKVSFHTFSTRELSYSLSFSDKVSVVHAIRKVEDWLSEDVCEGYYNEMMYNLRMHKVDMEMMSWNEAKEYFEIRGDFLGKQLYLLEAKVDEYGHFIIETNDYNDEKVIKDSLLGKNGF